MEGRTEAVIRARKSSVSCTRRCILLERGVTVRMLIDQPCVLVAN